MIPAGITRAPTLMASQVFLSNISRSSVSLLNVQEQLATGLRVNRFSDDPIRATGITVVQSSLSRHEQRLKNLGHAQGVLDQLDLSVADASELVLEGKGIASDQIGPGSDAVTRKNQSLVIDAMVRRLFDLSNRSTRGVYFFGGSTPASPPVLEVDGGYRYVGQGAGLATDLGLGESFAITLGGDNAIGEVSARHRGLVDLDPGLTLDTPLDDVRGTAGVGVRTGEISFAFNGDESRTIDLTGSVRVGDVVDRMATALAAYETEFGLTILGPGGVGVAGGSITIDVVGGGGGGDPELVFADAPNGTAATDLGLSAAAFSAGNTVGADSNPRLDWLTPLEVLAGVTVPLGRVRVRFDSGGGAGGAEGAGGRVHDIDLSGAQTIDDVRNLIERGAPGARVRINAAGTGLDIYNEVSGPTLRVEEVPGGADTATELGLRTLTALTPLSDFNNGVGVRIVDGVTDPVTGLIDPSRNVDFTIRLGGGQSVAVDLRPQDVVSVQTLVDRINSQIAAAETAGLVPAGAISAGLSDGANGIVLRDLAGLGQISVTSENNSASAEDIGLIDAVWDAGSASLTAQDRAGVRVDNLFTQLIELRDALASNDTRGIAIAGEHLEGSVDRLAAARALVGVYANRVQDATKRTEDLSVLDERMRSELQDLDFAEAAIRYTQLQTQLQAGLQTAASLQRTNLLDFLG